MLAVQVVQFAVLLRPRWCSAGSRTAASSRSRVWSDGDRAGTAAFAALGLLMAGMLRAEATLAAANLLYLLLLVGGAVLTPVAEYPESVQPVVELLPSAALSRRWRTRPWTGRCRGPAWR